MKGLFLIVLTAILLVFTGCFSHEDEDIYTNAGGYGQEDGNVYVTTDDYYVTTDDYNEDYNQADEDVSTNTEGYGQTGYNRDENGIHILTDRFFDVQMMEIRVNADDFLGRAIRYEGMFLTVPWGDELLHMVAREGDDCCGVGGFLGFEVYLNDIPGVEDYTWVEFTGVLERLYEDGFGYFLRLNAISMIEIDEPEI